MSIRIRSNSVQTSLARRHAKTSLFLTAAFGAIGFAAPAFADEPANKDEIIVTASPIERAQLETIVATSVISGEELERSLENTIGETLRRIPGVSTTYFGPGASRPIIRGLGGDRISVLDSGIGSIDASQTSPDHAVAVEPATAQRIEIVRGPGTLLYGSSAAGGVVNVFSGRIPSEVPENGVTGSLRIGGSTVDDGVEAAGGFDVEVLKLDQGSIVFHGDGFYRNADDINIPGFAESARLRALEAEEAGPDADEEEEAFGTVENTAFNKSGGSAGLSWVFDNGFIGVSGTAIDTFYGVPGGHEEGEEGEEEEGEEEGGVTIDLRQRRLDLDGEIAGNFLIFEKAKIRVGYADYTHTEFEPDGEAGTVFSNEGWEGRLELVERPVTLGGGVLKGALGAQFRVRDYSAIGEEAFVPPTQTRQVGVFALEEYELGALRLELGGRYENTRHEVEETGLTRQFDTFSVSGGVGAKLSEQIFVGVTGFRTARAPSIEELFSDGPHLATQAFEIGDPDLGVEIGRGVEATARFTNDRLYLAVNGFYTSYRDFIYETGIGEEEDGLPVFQFFADDATFRGFEFESKAELFNYGVFDIHADASVDLVRATIDVDGNNNLPRIPPLSGVFGVEARSDKADLRVEAEYAAGQDRVSEFELPTDSYTLLNTYLTLRPFETAGVSLRLAASNLTNEEARIHSSFLKDILPLPGRNFRFSVQGRF